MSELKTSPATIEALIPIEEVVTLAVRLMEGAESYFKNDTQVSDEDRELLRLFTKLCLAHRLTDLKVEEYRSALTNIPVWKALILERAQYEHFNAEEMAQLQNVVEQLPLFALALIGNSERSVPKRLEERMLNTVSRNPNSQRVYQASHD